MGRAAAPDHARRAAVRQVVESAAERHRERNSGCRGPLDRAHPPGTRRGLAPMDPQARGPEFPAPPREGTPRQHRGRVGSSVDLEVSGTHYLSPAQAHATQGVTVSLHARLGVFAARAVRGGHARSRGPGSFWGDRLGSNGCLVLPRHNRDEPGRSSLYRPLPTLPSPATSPSPAASPSPASSRSPSSTAASAGSAATQRRPGSARNQVRWRLA
jgi:hypothetical protein